MAAAEVADPMGDAPVPPVNDVPVPPVDDAPVSPVRDAPSTSAVVVTFRRPGELERTLRSIAAQTQSFRELLVVDNEPGERTSAIVERLRPELGAVTYLAAPSNLGPAGARTLGGREVLARAEDDGWVAFLDDDDPLPTTDLVSRLAATAERLAGSDPATAGVGLRGARLDRRTGRVVPVPGPGVRRVDHLHGNRLPMYRVGALRRVGLFDDRLFFGFEELELGLRLRRAGMSLYADGDLYEEVRGRIDGAEPLDAPGMRLEAPSLRRYYALRNVLVILRRERLSLQAVGWALVAGVLKPLVWLPIRPSLAWAHLRLNVAAIRDAATDRLGPRERVAGAAVAP